MIKRLVLVLACLCLFSTTAFAGIKEMEEAYKKRDYATTESEARKIIIDTTTSVQGKARAQYIIGAGFYNQGRLMIKGGGNRADAKLLYAKGIPDLQKVIDNYPTNRETCARAYYLIGISYRVLEDYRKEQEAFCELCINYSSDSLASVFVNSEGKIFPSMLEGIFKRSFGEKLLAVYPTRKSPETGWIYDHHPIDAKVSIGDLAVLCPRLDYGLSEHHMRFPGTLTLRPDTFIDVVLEIVESLAHWEVRRVLVVHGHGGNIAALRLVSRIALRDHGSLVASLMWAQL